MYSITNLWAVLYLYLHHLMQKEQLLNWLKLLGLMPLLL